MKAHVIGAGISGPVAAIALANSGYEVTMYERRNRYALNSPGILGITPENWRALNRLGVNVARYSLGTNMLDYFSGSNRFYEGYNITWSNLHNELIHSAIERGVNVRFGMEAPKGLTGIRVRAGGVGMAAKDGRPYDYSGYVVHRGLSSIRVNEEWVTVKDPHKNYLFNAGDIKNGASWALFTYNSKPPRGTVTTSTIPLIAWAIPKPFFDVIAMTPEWQMAPISDWQAPNTIGADGWSTFTIGDANGGMRPHTGMGANLGISEAISIPAMIGPDNIQQIEAENSLVLNRFRQRERGIRLGYEIMGSALSA
jgi:2-polyprenyl-6-methoxyphenol hydroxylase-like FAD-dependent oxidoreductase